MTNIRLRLDLSGVGLEFQGSQAFYDRWVEPILAATCQRPVSEPAAPVETPPAASSSVPDAEPDRAIFQPQSPTRFQQYVAQVGDRAATTEQQVMAFGFYLWNYEKRNVFGWDDLQGFFAMMRQDVPDDLEALIEDLNGRKRFLEAADERQWKLTTKGVNYVKNRLLGSV